MTRIDRSRVRASFETGASAYDRHAEVQKRVVSDLVKRLPATAPGTVLDVGSGTGTLLHELRGKYPGSVLYGIDLAQAMNLKARATIGGDAVLVTGDAEDLPFAEGSFDLVVSTSAFQWLDSLDRAFSEVLRVLVPGGAFVFALFGEGTLEELRVSYREALPASARGEDPTHRFFAAAEVGGALESAGFLDPEVFLRVERVYHPDVPDLLRGLRAIGAGNASEGPRRGLGERAVMLRMMEIYIRKFGGAGGMIPATYGVVHGAGRKPRAGEDHG